MPTKERWDNTGHRCLCWAETGVIGGARHREVLSRASVRTRRSARCWRDGGERRARLLRAEREEVDPRVQLPEALPTDEHLHPPLARIAHAVLGIKPDTRVLGRNQAHPLQLRKQVLALEDALAVDINTPLALRLALVGRQVRRGGRHVRIRPGLMEVPPQAGPEHHGDLASGRGRRLELIRARVRNGRNKQVVIAQTRFAEAVDVVAFRQLAGRVDVRVCGGGGEVVVLVVLAVEDDGPTGREDVLVGMQVVGFEVEAAEDGGDGEGLPVG